MTSWQVERNWTKKNWNNVWGRSLNFSFLFYPIDLRLLSYLLIYHSLTLYHDRIFAELSFITGWLHFCFLHLTFAWSGGFFKHGLFRIRHLAHELMIPSGGLRSFLLVSPELYCTFYFDLADNRPQPTLKKIHNQHKFSFIIFFRTE